MSGRITRRRALARAAFGGAVLLAGCGGGSTGRGAARSGSTLRSSYADPDGEGSLAPAAPEPLLERIELSPRAAAVGALASFAHLTDAHVLDAQSPARVSFLDRLGSPFQSTFRPQETLTAQVLAGAIRAINAFAPEAVIQGGDLTDNAQANELDTALAALRGGRVDPHSGAPGYHGVQSAGNADPFYYRPDVDAPRHPGLLAAAQLPFRSPGLRAPWYPVLGDHDVLVAGVLPPSATTQQVALGTRAFFELPSGLPLDAARVARPSAAPDGLGDPVAIDRLLRTILDSARSVAVASDPRRREVGVPEAVARLRAASAQPGSGAWLDYSFDIGPRVRVIVLDLVRRRGGSGGLVHPGQAGWLRDQLRRAHERWTLVVSHQPLDTSEGGPALLALLDRHPRMVAAVWGHTHRNRITPRRSPAGGYWLISTASLIDHPQQARAFRLLETAGGGVALQTWMLDHVPDRRLGDISRQLAYLDAQGGRPAGLEGGRLDRNVTLYRSPPTISG